MIVPRRVGLYGIWGIASASWASGYSMNVTDCPGYTLDSLVESHNGLTAQLTLAGPSCNAFGQDIAQLTVCVVHQTQTTLHVKIFDTVEEQFTIPKSIIARPAAPVESYTNASDLLFNYDASPFAFWITRRSDPDAMPLFDTRVSSLPPTPIPPLNPSDPRTAFNAFHLVFEDRYLQVASALPFGTNIYGLGEVISSSGFKRDVGANGGTGTIQTNWNGGLLDPIDENLYGTHPVYIEHRYNETTNKSSSSGVLLLSSSGADIFLQTPPNSNVSFIEYRMLGGILDFYFFSGPTPSDVIAQYGAIIGYPAWQPAWAFGFHLCRWGYQNIWEIKDVVEQMRSANIPQEVQWSDIDLYHAYRDFTTDPVSFPPEEVEMFISDLAANNQYYIPIVDAAISVTDNATDVYDPFTEGVDQDVWVKNPDGSIYIGAVWPGYSVFPDWFSANIQSFWTEALSNWSELGITFSGIWLDMNEASSFCNYSCGTGANFSALPPKNVAGRVLTEWPECYNATIWGTSGNMTIDGISTNSCTANSTTASVAERGMSATRGVGVDLTDPPYTIHNAVGALSTSTIATNATHQGGYVELDVHNMFGLMEEKTTYLALQTMFPDRRPFLISRSTFPSAGKWTGHWLGDNFSKWKYMYFSIQGILQFQIYQIPMVGADTCGFYGNTDEELCNRWMQLSAFTPFYRNHNTYGAILQEPYRWPSVAEASRRAIAIRYALLPYWYTLFANASMTGLPPIRALFYEFPDEPELFAVDRQWLVGRDILVTPVLTPGATTVDGMFPGRGRVIWRDWYTHAAVVHGDADLDHTATNATTLDAPLGHIPVHVRDRTALLLHHRPAYTVAETRAGPYALLVSLDAAGAAFGTAYLDDGASPPPTPNRTVTFEVGTASLLGATFPAAAARMLQIRTHGTYVVGPKLVVITILGVAPAPCAVAVRGRWGEIGGWRYDASTEKLVVYDLAIDLGQDTDVVWRLCDDDPEARPSTRFGVDPSSEEVVLF